MRQVLLSEKLLREYVRNLLKEDDGLGAYSGEYSQYGLSNVGDSPFGVTGYGSTNDLISAFITPFTDVVKTAAAETKKIAAHTATLLRVAFEVIISTLIPGIGANYEAIFNRRDERLNKIKEEYRDVYERTDKALASDDARLIAFMVNPAATLGYFAAKKTPAAVAGSLSIATGGISDELMEKSKGWSKEIGRTLLGRDESGKSRKSLGSGKRKDPDSFDWNKMGESRLFEDDQKKSSKSDKEKQKSKEDNSEDLARQFLIDFLKNPKVQNALKQTPKFAAMSKTATENEKETLKEIYEEAVMTSKGLNSLEKIEQYIKKSAKKQPKASEALKKIDEIKKIKDQKEKQIALNVLSKKVKDASKEFAQMRIKSEIEKFKKAGLTDTDEVIKNYISVLQKVNSL